MINQHKMNEGLVFAGGVYSDRQDKLDHARDVQITKESFYLKTKYSRQDSAIARATLGFSLDELWDLTRVRKGYK